MFFEENVNKDQRWAATGVSTFVKFDIDEGPRPVSTYQQPTIMGVKLLEILNPTPPDTQVNYLLGLRGILVLQAFLCIFLQLFAPTAVKDSNLANWTGAKAHEILRDIFSVLLWNPSLVYSSFVLLMGRTIILPFLADPTKRTTASCIFRRPFRLVLPVIVAFGISTALFNGLGTQYVTSFLASTNNQTATTPTPVTSFLIYFNSVFNLFWTVRDFSLQNGSTSYPGQILWLVSVIFQQSYTVYTIMIILPYTRPAWRVKALAVFILAAWWVQSWSWYSATGLLLSDMVVNMHFRSKLQAGLPIGISSKASLRVPSWILSGLLLIAGLVQEYLWTAWRPRDADGELRAHGGIYTTSTGGLNHGANFSEPQARVDNFCILLGVMLFLELSEVARRCLASKPFVWFGKRSYCKLAPVSCLIDGVLSRNCSLLPRHSTHSLHHRH